MEQIIERQKRKNVEAEYCMVLGAKISRDGNKWCASIGSNPMEGVFVYRDTVSDAMDALFMALEGEFLE